LLYSLLVAGGTYFAQKRYRKTKARLDELLVPQFSHAPVWEGAEGQSPTNRL
jgi:hypothetical protein